MEERKILEKIGAVKKGHFLLTSGLHSDVYFDKFRLLQYPEYVKKFCKKIADRFKKEKITLVVGPEKGGIIIAYQVAEMLGVRCAFAEKSEDKLCFKRDFYFEEKEKILIVDDVLTTGGSIKKVIDLIKSKNWEIKGIAVLIDRSVFPLNLNMDVFSVVKVEANVYRPEDCPLCKKGLELKKLGGK